MNEYLKSFIYLMLVISILRMLSPSKEYNKYIKFFVSLLFVVSILSPIISVVKKGEFSSFLNKNYVTMDELETSINNGNIDINTLVKDEYKKKLENNIKSTLKKQYYVNADVLVVINEDESSAYYGDIKNVTVTLNEEDINKKDKIKSYINKTYMLDIGNINIKTGSVSNG